MNPEDYSATLKSGKTVKVVFQRRLGAPGDQELWEILVKDGAGKLLETTIAPLAKQGPDRNERLTEQSRLLIEKLNAAMGSS